MDPRLTVDHLRRPPPLPEQAVVNDIEALKSARLDGVERRLQAELRANGGQIVQDLQLRPAETPRDQKARVANYINGAVIAQVSREGQLGANYAQIITNHGVSLDPVKVEEVSEENFKASIDARVRNVVEAELQEKENEVKRAERQKKADTKAATNAKRAQIDPLVTALREEIVGSIDPRTGATIPTNIKDVDVDKWISSALKLCEELGPPFDQDIKKYRKIEGVLNNPGFNFPRISGAVTAIASHVGAVAAFAVSDFRTAAFVCSALTIGNVLWNFGCVLSQIKKMSVVQGDVAKNISDATSMAGVILWTGILFKTMRDHAPSYLINNGKTQTFGNTALTTEAHALELVRNIAGLVYKDAADTKTELDKFLQRDTRVNSGWAQASEHVDAFFGRMQILPALMSFEGLFAAVPAQIPLLIELTKNVS